jgi:hypothetical protein
LASSAESAKPTRGTLALWGIPFMVQTQRPSPNPPVLC